MGFFRFWDCCRRYKNFHQNFHTTPKMYLIINFVVHLVSVCTCTITMYNHALSHTHHADVVSMLIQLQSIYGTVATY